MNRGDTNVHLGHRPTDVGDRHIPSRSCPDHFNEGHHQQRLGTHRVPRELSYFSLKYTDYGYHKNGNYKLQKSRSLTMPLHKPSDEGDAMLPRIGGERGETRLQRKTPAFCLGSPGLEETSQSPPKPRSINLDVHRKVVTHLRRQLNRRLEARLALKLRHDVTAQQLLEEGGQRYLPSGGAPLPSQDQVPGFQPLHNHQHHAAEGAEGVSRRPLAGNVTPTTRVRHQRRWSHYKQRSARTPSDQGLEKKFDEKAIKTTPESLPVTDEPGGGETTGGDEPPPGGGDVEENTHTDTTPGEWLTGTSHQGERPMLSVQDQYWCVGGQVSCPEEGLEEDDRRSAVSPVDTPYIQTLEEEEDLEVRQEEVEEELLRGNVTCPFLPDDRRVRLFISACCTDSEGERSVLVERVYPALQGFVAEHGYSLEVMDPHWGLQDLTLDDHSQEQLIERLLTQARLNQRGINQVTFLGQKYGEAVLPATIPRTEYEIILAAVKEDHQRQVEAAAEASREAGEKERKKDREEEKKAMKRGSVVAEFGRRLEVIPDEDEQSEAPPRIAEKRVSFIAEASTDDVTSGSEKQEEGRRREGVEEGRRGEGVEEGRRREGVEAWRLKAKTVGRQALTVQRLRRQVRLEGETADPGIFNTWYRLDTNIQPPVYRLQNISSHYKDYIRNDAGKRQGARQLWLHTSGTLLKVLHKYAHAHLGDEAALKYTRSLLSIECALLSPSQDNKHCFWFRRDIEDLQHHLADARARDYVDVHPISGELDQDKVKALQELRQVRIEGMLSKSQMWRYPLTWHSAGVSLTSTRSHSVYLDGMSKEFYNVITQSLTQAFTDEAQRQASQHPQLLKEISQHVFLCQQSSRSFHGRKQQLQHIKDYIRSSQQCPLVVHGRVGCGMTSLMSKAAWETQRWVKGCAVVFRSVGVTPDSTNLRLLLRDVCHQLAIIYNNKIQHPQPNDHKGLVNDFNFRLSLASEECPVVLFIDNCSLLSGEFDGRKMLWLPRELPPHVHIIVSTLPGDQYECLPSLQHLYPDSPDTFLPIPDLQQEDAITILEHWYKAEKRTLTSPQFDALLDAFKQLSTPLYLRLVFEESLRWPSYLPVSEVRLASTLKKAALTIFGRLEKEHGEPLVRRALGYLTAARSGISSSEMEDLLSLDDIVMEDVFHHHKPSLRRLPPLCWLHLKHHLRPYTKETLTDNTVLLRWFHPHFHEAATDRYLNQRDKAPSYHRALAEYFSDTWSTRPKPTPKGKPQLRHITAQPLYRVTHGKNGQTTSKVYNLRRLNELPYHLLNSQQLDEMKKKCLLNYEFLLAKLTSTSLRAVSDDLQMAQLLEPAEPNLRLLSDTLSLSAPVLNNDPAQLASQLVGRLHEIVTKDVPVAPADPIRYPYVKPLFKQAIKSRSHALIPHATCLTPPGGILFDLLYGHNEPITAVVATADGQRAVTTACDNTLKVWELRTGRVTRTIKGVGEHVFSIRLNPGNAIVVTSEKDRIRVWSLGSGLLIRDIDEYDDPANICITNEGSLLAAFYDGCRKLRVFSLQLEDVTLTREVEVEEKIGNIHKDNSILVSPSSNGLQVLYAFRSDCVAYVRNMKSGNRTRKLQFQGLACALATTQEYFVVGVKTQYMKLQEKFQLELFDVRNGQFVRTVHGCTGDNVCELHVNQLGSHALAISTSEANNTSDIAIWNLETADHKHLAKHSKISLFGACADIRYCLSASPNENSLRIWNLSNNMNQPAPKAKHGEGLEKLFPLGSSPRYVVAKYLSNGSLSIWNVTKKKFSGVMVQSMTGILDASDVMIVKDAKIVILTGKGFSNVSTDLRPVFQKILMYDTLTGKFTRRIPGCYIVPCQPHEYAILDEHGLLGLSENRSHFVVWSLSSGHVAYRIKSNFKKLEESESEEEYGTKRKQTTKPRRSTSAKMLPWDRRAETQSARQRHHQAKIEEERCRIEGLKKEKENAIEQYLMSRDMSTIVASYYSHHLCVFDLPSRSHKATLLNEHSMLLLHIAAISPTGSHVVHTNYDDDVRMSYVTLWDCEEGVVKRRLRNEKNVSAIAISDDAGRVVLGKACGELRVWDPLVNSGSGMRKIRGYASLSFGVGSQIHITNGGARAVVFAGDISVWDLDRGTVLSVFTPDMKIQGFTMALDGQMVAFGLRDRADVVNLHLVGEDEPDIEKTGKNLFGEASDGSSEEEEEEEDQQDQDF